MMGDGVVLDPSSLAVGVLIRFRSTVVRSKLFILARLGEGVDHVTGVPDLVRSAGARPDLDLWGSSKHQYQTT